VPVTFGLPTTASGYWLSKPLAESLIHGRYELHDYGLVTLEYALEKNGTARPFLPSQLGVPEQGSRMIAQSMVIGSSRLGRVLPDTVAWHAYGPWARQVSCYNNHMIAKHF
jgi:hypothetical protein